MIKILSKSLEYKEIQILSRNLHKALGFPIMHN